MVTTLTEVEVWNDYNDFLRDLGSIKNPTGEDYDKMSLMLKKLQKLYVGYEVTMPQRNKFGDVELVTKKGHFDQVLNAMRRELVKNKALLRFTTKAEEGFVKDGRGKVYSEAEYKEAIDAAPDVNIMANLIVGGFGTIFESGFPILGAEKFSVKQPTQLNYINLTTSFLEQTQAQPGN